MINLKEFDPGCRWPTPDRFESAVELIEKFPVKSIYHKPEPTKWTAGGTLDGGWYPV